jgi:hypothetical protein
MVFVIALINREICSSCCGVGVRVIDKLEVIVPNGKPFAREFATVYADAAADGVIPWRSSRHYTNVVDLRMFGFDSILHAGCKRGKDGNHKLELLDTGSKSYSEIVAEVERIFDADPLKLECKRVDLCADVQGVPVGWFHDRLRATFKQFSAKIGVQEFSEMGRREMQTLYYGKRPNCFRIYNKTAEMMNQYKALCRAPKSQPSSAAMEAVTGLHLVDADTVLPVARDVNSDAELPSFRELFGVDESAILTRVERQIGGGRVPEQLNTIARLKANALDFNPFERLQFLSSGVMEPRPEDYDFETYCTGMFLRKMANTHGMQWTRAFMNRDRNGSRRARKYASFLPFNEGGISAGKLFELYRETLSRQLAA